MFPSPKSHFHPVAFVERSVKLTERGAYPDVTLLVKLATVRVVIVLQMRALRYIAMQIFKL
jgi:hypothetical protein